MKLLELKNITFSANNQRIIDDISLDVEHGDFISIVGPSGSGKSTLLKIIADLLPPDRGELRFRGKPYTDYPPTGLRQQIMMCFQTPYLFGETVVENLDFPFQVRHEKPDRAKMIRLLKDFQLDESFLEKDVTTLSGGEKQRIALIRSLMFDPDILLLDEVTASLDVENTEIVEQAMRDRHEQGTTILMITHNPAQSRRNANRLIEITDGRISREEAL